MCNRPASVSSSAEWVVPTSQVFVRVTDLLTVADLRACSIAQFGTWQGPKFPAPSLSVCPAPAPGLSLISPDAVFPRWYHGHMSGGQAETLLQAKGEPWTFLVRESLSQPGDFVLSVLSDQPKAGPGSPLRVTHIKVMCEVRPLGTREGAGGSLCAHSRALGEGQPGLWSKAGGPGRETGGLTWSPSGRTLHSGGFGDLRQPH